VGKRQITGAAVALSLLLSACSPVRPAGAPAPHVRPAATPAESPTTYPVGLRRLDLRRGPDRPLPTLVFYPAARQPFGFFHPGFFHPGAFQPGAFQPSAFQPSAFQPSAFHPGALPPAVGRFPLVLFCHGLSGSPERYAATLAGFASAGFVVVAPRFPHTSEFTDDFRRSDIARQPADVRFVLARVRRLNLTPGDPLRRRIATDRIAVIGHSAGGYTATGLLTAGHDPRLRAAVVMAGWAAPGAFRGPPAAVLFVQGTADPIVPVAVSRAVYDRVPWPKSYLLLRRDSHATYLKPGDTGYKRMRSVVTDFLRWTLDGDPVAGRRLPRRD
jgi:dienelactone hydrolase